MAEERSGFLGRWSRRKLDALQGRALDEPALADKAAAAPLAGADGAAPKPGPAAFAPASGRVPAPAAAQSWRAGECAGTASSPAPAAGQTCNAAATPAAPNANANANAPAPAPEKILSLEDVKALTQDSDFKPFMARHVGADVRNAAMKKLFADPHYNVMDGLDIYIDDYAIADPLPQAMLKQMASARFLNLLDDGEGDKASKNATAQGGAAARADPMAASADDSCKHPDVQGVSPPEAQSPSQPDTVAQCAEPLAAVPADSLHSFGADHASQAKPADGFGARQDHHAHSHLRLQPDHAAPAPNAGRGAG